MINEFENVMKDDDLLESDDEAEYDDEHKQRITNAVIKRIKTSKNNIDKKVGGQSDLESLDDEDDIKNKKRSIDNIISQKTKSIADVLLNDGIKRFYGSYFQQELHPYARNKRVERKITNPVDPKVIGQDMRKHLINGGKIEDFTIESGERIRHENTNQMVRAHSGTKGTIEFSFDENEEEYRGNDRNFLI